MARNQQLASNLYGQAIGTSSTASLLTIFENRAPNSVDVNYQVGKRWVDTTSSREYILEGFTSTDGITTANWIDLSAGSPGNVTSFSSGDLSPLFTTNVTDPTSTPDLQFSLENADANTYFGNATNVSAAPSYTSAGALTTSDDTNVTLTVGGDASTSLLRSASITAGWTGTLSPDRGGTGVNNDTSTITIDGDIEFNGAFDFEGTLTGNTTVTFPTSGTLATTGDLPVPASLTTSNDTNVTLTLGGSPTTALLQAASITAGWSGELGVGRGGTGSDLSATGGASQVLQQTTAGGNITVGQLAASNLSNGTTGSGSVVLSSGASITTPIVSGEKVIVSALGSLTTGTTTIDLSTAQVFTATITGGNTITFAFSNAPAAGQSQVIILRLENGGAGTIIWPLGTQFNGSIAPSLTASGVDMLGVYYDVTTTTYMVFEIGIDMGA